MPERGVSQITVDIDLGAERERGRDVIDDSRKDDGSHVYEDEKEQRVKSVLRDEMVERVTLQKRYQNIDKRPAEPENDHSDKTQFVRFQERDEPAETEERQRFFVFLFHIPAASSSESDWLS